MEAPARLSLTLAGAAAAYDAVVAVDGQVRRVAKAAGLGKRLVEVLRIRVSQLNGCAFCLRLHTADALAGEEGADQLAVFAAWRETAYFSDAERTALAFAEAVTRLSDGPVRHQVEQDAVRALATEGTAATAWVAITMNVWNRIAVTSRYPVGPES